MTVQPRALWRNGLAATLQQTEPASTNVYAETAEKIQNLSTAAQDLNATLTVANQSAPVTYNIYIHDVDAEAVAEKVVKAINERSRQTLRKQL